MLMDKKRKILLVDDVPQNLEVMINILKEEYTVVVATNGYKALELVHTLPMPDIILLDIMMPKMDGFEVCKRLKSNCETDGIPIIFITSKDNSNDEEKGLKLGAVDYITKPVIPAIVKARVHNYLELRRHQKNLQEMIEERTQELNNAKEAIIDAMGIVSECRDPETAEHIFRTKAYVNILAKELAKLDKYKSILTPKIIENMTLAAPMHDLGKINIPDEVLLKPGKLNEKEWQIMKTHAQIGEQMIKLAQHKFKFNEILHMAEDIALTHHERYDGTGYPNKLKANDIPISGRIMSVADVYDAIISKRPYKKAMTHEDAIEYITSHKGSQFDPDVVNAFLVQAEAIRIVALEFSENI